MTRIKNLSKLLLLWPLAALGEELPTRKGPFMPTQIGVSHRYITALIFDSPVCEVNLASDAYVAKLSGHYLLLRCCQPGALPTSLFVTYADGKAFLHARLCFAPDPPKTYDLREDKQGQQPAVPALVFERLAYLAGLQQAHKDIGLRQDQLTFVLMNVLTDKKHLYLKLLLANGSGIDYTIERVRFCFRSSRKKQIELPPVLSDERQCIAAGAQQALMYVLPAYGVSAKGKLLLEVQEANGDRGLQLSIPSHVLAKAPRYQASITPINQ